MNDNPYRTCVRCAASLSWWMTTDLCRDCVKGQTPADCLFDDDPEEV